MGLRTLSLAATLTAGLLAPSPSLASDQAPTVAEIVVRAPGPAMWRITRGPSTVWVLGTTEMMSQHQTWSSVRLSGVLDRARALIPPPKASGSYLQGAIPQAVARNGGHDLSAELLEPLRSRYYALRARLKLDPHQWDGLAPAWAAMMLLSDVRSAAALTDPESSEAVPALARARRVKILKPARYSAAAINAELDELPAETAQGVLADAVDAAEYQLAHASILGAAWARGDVAGLRANMGPEDLETWVLRRTVALHKVQEHRTSAAVTAIDRALAEPGESVMVLRLPVLVRRGGALDRLRRRGAQVVEPGEWAQASAARGNPRPAE